MSSLVVNYLVISLINKSNARPGLGNAKKRDHYVVLNKVSSVMCPQKTISKTLATSTVIIIISSFISLALYNCVVYNHDSNCTKREQQKHL